MYCKQWSESVMVEACSNGHMAHNLCHARWTSRTREVGDRGAACFREACLGHVINSNNPADTKQMSLLTWLLDLQKAH